MSLAEKQLLFLVMAGAVIYFLFRPRRWKGSGYAHGTARLATERDLYQAHMFSKRGLIIGRTTRRMKVIRLNKYVHTNVIAPTGSGKGVSLVLVTLMSYRGSVFCFDPKGENYQQTAYHRRRMGQKVIRLDPFNVVGPGGDSFNILDLLRPGDDLIDEARAMAAAMVLRPPEGDKEPVWNDLATMMILAFIVATAVMAKDEYRNLSTVREMLSANPKDFAETITRLQALGGIPARLGNQLATLNKADKEMASVRSSADTHTNFLDSPAIHSILKSSTFSMDELLQPGKVTIYFILPSSQMEAQKAATRLFVSTIMRFIMKNGMKRGGEMMMVLDECNCLAQLESLALALQMGRSSGIRLMMLWQSSGQMHTAFKIPNLVADNSDAQIFFGVNDYATAEHVSKSLGTFSLAIASDQSGDSRSYQTGGQTNGSYGSSTNRTWSEVSRPILFPAEVMQLGGEYMIALVKGIPPLLARRIFWYSDPLFKRRFGRRGWCLVLILIALTVWWFRH